MQTFHFSQRKLSTTFDLSLSPIQHFLHLILIYFFIFRLPAAGCPVHALAATSKKHQLATSERRNTKVRAPGRELSRIHHKFRLV